MNLAAVLVRNEHDSRNTLLHVDCFALQCILKDLHTVFLLFNLCLSLQIVFTTLTRSLSVCSKNTKFGNVASCFAHVAQALNISCLDVINVCILSFFHSFVFTFVSFQ